MQTFRAGYVDTAYVDFGYVVEFLGTGVEFRYSTTTVSFTKGFKYASHNFNFYQANESTALNFPVRTASKLSQLTLDAVFPYMKDTELTNLRTFMFTTLPLFETFQLALIGQDLIVDAKFETRRLSVRQVQNNFNEVTIPLIII